MHFREAKLPIHVKVERATGEEASGLPCDISLRDSTMALIKLQEEYRAKAMQNIARAQERQKTQYDRKHNTNTMLNIGDKVLKENTRNQHRLGGKLDKCWTGPFVIHEDLGKGRFRLKTLEGIPIRQMIHCARLKLYHETVDQVDDAANQVDDGADQVNTADQIDNAANQVDDGADQVNTADQIDNAANQVDDGADQIDNAAERVDDTADLVDDTANQVDAADPHVEPPPKKVKDLRP